MGNWGFSTYSPLSKTFVVDKVGDDQPGHRHPHAVDGVTMQLMAINAMTYHTICLPRLLMLRNTKFFWTGKLMISPMAMAIM